MPSFNNVVLMMRVLTVESKLNVLVFGDSFGDTGPTYHALQDMFDKHNIPANVQSSAIGGTSSCHWAGIDNGMSMVEQTQQLFPDVVDGPDYVWYTMGANDQWQDDEFQGCLKNSKSYDEAQACSKTESAKIFACTTTMLDNFWKAYPKAKVLQTGYEVPCQNLICQETIDRVFYRAYCGDNITCSNHLGYDFQENHMADLRAHYPSKPYNTISIIGAAQKAAGIAGAEVGKPAWDKGAKCDWTVYCCHPKYGTPAGDAWRDAFWDLYFNSELSSNQTSVV